MSNGREHLDPKKSEEENSEDEELEQDQEVELSAEQVQEAHDAIDKLNAWRTELDNRERTLVKREKDVERKEELIKIGLQKESEDIKRQSQAPAILENEDEGILVSNPQISKLKQEKRDLKLALGKAEEQISDLKESLNEKARRSQSRNQLKKYHKLAMERKEEVIEIERNTMKELKENLASMEQRIINQRKSHAERENQLKESIDQLESKAQKDHLLIYQQKEAISTLELQLENLREIMQSSIEREDKRLEEDRLFLSNKKSVYTDNKLFLEDNLKEKDLTKKEGEKRKEEKIQKFIEEDEVEQAEEESKAKSAVDFDEYFVEESDFPEAEAEAEAGAKLFSGKYEEEHAQFHVYLSQLISHPEIYKKAINILDVVDKARVYNLATSNDKSTEKELAGTLFLTNQFLDKITSGKKAEITDRMCFEYGNLAKHFHKDSNNPLTQKIGAAMLVFLGAVVFVLQLPFLRYKTGLHVVKWGASIYEGTKPIAKNITDFLDEVKPKKQKPG